VCAKIVGMDLGPQFTTPPPNEGGQLRPKRLTGEEMDKIQPGWTERALERAHRPDGQNGY
jgi:hypothetical protein